MIKIGVYKIVNIITNDCYIGSSININKRWSEHKRTLKNGNHHSIILQRAYDKYGNDNFKYIIILECNKNDILIFEQKYFDLFNPKYNILKIAGNRTGKKHSNETKEKLRNINLGKKRDHLSSETKALISKANKGRVFTIDQRSKMSKSKLGKKRSEITNEKLKQYITSDKMREMQIKTVEKRKLNGTYLMSQDCKDALSKANSVEVICVNYMTNEIIYAFESYKKAAEFLNKSEVTLWRMIKNNKKIKEFIWMRKKDYVP